MWMKKNFKLLDVGRINTNIKGARSCIYGHAN